MEANGFVVLDLLLTRWGSAKLKSTLVVFLEIQVSLSHTQVKEIK